MLNHTNADDEGSNASSDYREWNPPHMRKHESRLSSVLKKTLGLESKDEVALYAKEMWLENLPLSIIKDLSGEIMWCFGCIAYLLVIGIFAYALYEGATNASKTFISLDESSGICQTVPKDLSGIFYMDTEGHWSGTDHFLDERAIYEITFNRLHLHGKKSFEALMATIFGTLESWGQIALRAPLSDQILMWMTWQMKVDVAGTSQIFRLTGHPRRVFHAEKFLGGVASVQGHCSVTASPDYNSESGLLSLGWKRQAFTNDTVCMDALDPMLFNPHTISLLATQDTESEYFTLSWHIEGIITAISFNIGLLLTEHLIHANVELDEIIVYNGHRFALRNMFYSRYPSMNPMRCLFPNETVEEMSSSSTTIIPPVCFIRMTGNQLVLPIVSHLFPGCQSCPSVASPPPFNQDASVCDEMHLVVSFIYFKPQQTTDITAGRNESLWSLLDFIKYRYELGPKSSAADSEFYMYPYYVYMMKYAFGTSWYAFAGVDVSIIPNFLFCQGKCHLISIGFINELKAITKNYFNFPGSCRDTVTIKDHWSKFYTPPAPIVEDFLQCTREQMDVFLDTVGNASGFTESIGSLLLLGMIPFIMMFKRRQESQIIDDNEAEDQEDEDEEEKMVDKLAKLLLKIQRQPHLRRKIDFNHVIDNMYAEKGIKVESDIHKHSTSNGNHQHYYYAHDKHLYGPDDYGNYDYDDGNDDDDYDDDDDDDDIDSADITLRTIKSTITRGARGGHGESEDESIQYSSPPPPASTSSSIFNVFRPFNLS